MGQITNGIDKVEVSFDQGTTWEVLGNTNIDSFNFVEEEGTTNDFNVEEQDDPIFSRTIPGKKTATFQIADPDLECYQKVFGGTITGTGATAVWEAPRARTPKEVTVRVTPQVGYTLTVNRALLKPRLNNNLGKNKISMIDISMDVLTPTDPLIPPYTVGTVR